MKLLPLLFAFVFILDGCLADSDNNNNNEIYILEQAIEDSDFLEIATLNLRAVKQHQSQLGQQFQFQQQNAPQPNNPPMSDVPLFPVLVQCKAYDQITLEQLKRSALSSDEPVLRLRLCAKNSGDCPAMTFAYLKSVVLATMQLNLTVHYNSNFNRINSISAKAHDLPAFPQKPKKQQQQKQQESQAPQQPIAKSLAERLERVTHLNVYVSVQTTRSAALPDTEYYLAKVKEELEAKERQAQGGNESFLSKYWIYIVPVLVIMFIMPMISPEGGGGGR